MRKEDKLLLLGMVFGDGHVRYDRPELQIVNGVAQLELLKYKVEIVSRIVGYKINISKSEANYRFSVQNPYFKFLRKWCYYANGDRRFAKQVLNRLTLQAIAIWYMDDGSLHAKKQNGKIHAYELTISCCAKNEIDAQNIVDVFNQRFNISFTIKRNKGLFSVRCGTKEARKFIALIDDYVIPSMRYKTAPINQTGST